MNPYLLLYFSKVSRFLPRNRLAVMNVPLDNTSFQPSFLGSIMNRLAAKGNR